MPTLNWIGKEKVVNHHLEVPSYTLERKCGFSGEDGADKAEAQNGGTGQKDAPLSGRSAQRDTCHSKNLIIHGDNLLALKAMMPEYEGRVDCIYINPPYNMGEKKWVYNVNVNDPPFDITGRHKYFMTYQHQGVEVAVAVNKLVELMRRM